MHPPGAAQPSRGSSGKGQGSVLGTTRGRGELPQGPGGQVCRSSSGREVRSDRLPAGLPESPAAKKGTPYFWSHTLAHPRRAESLPELNAGLLESIMGVPGPACGAAKAWENPENRRELGFLGVREAGGSPGSVGPPGATSVQVPQVTPRGCAPGVFPWLLSQTAWPPGWGGALTILPPTPHTHWSSWQGRAWPGQGGAFSAPAGPQPSPHSGT